MVAMAVLHFGFPIAQPIREPYRYAGAVIIVLAGKAAVLLGALEIVEASHRLDGLSEGRMNRHVSRKLAIDEYLPAVTPTLQHATKVFMSACESAVGGLATDIQL